MVGTAAPISPLRPNVEDRAGPAPAADAPVPIGTAAGLLRAAAVWLGAVAVLGGLLGAVAVWFAFNPLFGGEPSEADGARALLMAAGLVCGPLGAAVVTWRAASPGHTRAGIVAFVLGAGTLLVLLAPAVPALLPTHGGFYGFDPYRGADAARLPSSVAFLVPALLMVVGTLLRWCAEEAPGSHRRAWATLAAIAVVAVPAGVLLIVAWWAPSCPSGRTCLPEAGISFERPAGWSPTRPDDGLYAASAGSESTRFVIEDGASILTENGREVPGDLDELERTVPRLLAGGGGFGRNSEISVRRVDLPAGPAIRIAYTSATSFNFTYYQTNVTHWLNVDGRLIVLEYMTSYGEGTPGATASDPPAVRRLLESIRPL